MIEQPTEQEAGPRGERLGEGGVGMCQKNVFLFQMSLLNTDVPFKIFLLNKDTPTSQLSRGGGWNLTF